MLSRCFHVFTMSCLIGLASGSIANASVTGEPFVTQGSSFFPSPNAPSAFTPASAGSISSEFFPQEPPRTSGRPPGFPIGLEAEWITGSEVDLSTYDASVKLPLLLGRNAPPPIVKFGFGYTAFSAPDEFGIPDELFEYSAGLSWVRKLNDRWAIRTMLGVGMATDNLNISSDAWQFRGGIFAIYETSPRWKWTFGAIALGRNDLPVLPAIGAVWIVNETTRVDLMLPNPRANFLLSDNGSRQHWVYLGGGLNGNTWAFETTDATDDTLTYGDVRLVAGWESRPSAPVGAPYVLGRKYYAEVGYAFSRDLEFENEDREVSLGDAFLFRVSTRY